MIRPQSTSSRFELVAFSSSLSNDGCDWLNIFEFPKFVTFLLGLPKKEKALGRSPGYDLELATNKPPVNKEKMRNVISNG